MLPYAQVALSLPLEDLFDYAVPASLRNDLQVGMRVKVPFGKRVLTGVCVSLQNDSKWQKTGKIKEILEVLDSYPVVSSAMMEFTRWMAHYYCSSLGESLDAVVPSVLSTSAPHKKVSWIYASDCQWSQQNLSDLQNKVLQFVAEFPEGIAASEVRQKLQISLSPIQTLVRKGILTEIKKEIHPDPFAGIEVEKDTPPVLNEEQRKALDSIEQLIEQQQFATVLLHGVTGSGKTEIYLHSIEKVLSRGGEAIVLVPEIALTPQTVMRFRRRFSNIAVLHSELAESQRSYQWQQIHEGKIQVVIGPRSALFAPTHNLGLIIVDEEHEPSFKQQNTPRYHARDLAVKRAQMHNCVAILGSATPSLESYCNARQKRYHFFSLPDRIGQSNMPKLIVVDMKEECTEQKKFVYFSRTLLWDLEKVLKRGEQAILFLNRRGFATTLSCPGCGYTAKCSYCDIALTYHKKRDIALCHYCNTDYIAPEACPVCKFPSIRYVGAGTERIEKILRKSFPEARITRMDSDTMTRRDSYEKTFAAFERREIDLLLGTQMIAKGLDFPNVTLVGIISADTSLQLPDFRSAERTFQLVVQVAGRSGRGELPGRVIVQTYHPHHYAIQMALQQDYLGFAEHEMKLREELGYPPFGRILRVLLEGKNEEKIVAESERIAGLLEPVLQKTNSQLLGPTPAPLSMIKSRHRYHMIVKSKNARELRACVQAIAGVRQSTSQIRVHLDVDPVSLM